MPLPPNFNPFNIRELPSRFSLLIRNSKLKLDQAFKPVLRGVRRAIRRAFDNSGLAKGMHHWDEAKWLLKAGLFFEHIGFESYTYSD